MLPGAPWPYRPLREKELALIDVVVSAVRSRMMSAIRGRDTKPEMLVRRYLHGVGLRFRICDGSLPGSPDLTLPRYRVAIFVHGCFWHQHPACLRATLPGTRQEFWRAKFQANKARDSLVAERLHDLGWTVLTIWECQTRCELELDQLAWKILAEPSRPRRSFQSAG